MNNRLIHWIESLWSWRRLDRRRFGSGRSNFLSEQLESRLLLAAVNSVSISSEIQRLELEAEAGEELTVSTDGVSYFVTTNRTFTDNRSDGSGDISGFGSESLIITLADSDMQLGFRSDAGDSHLTFSDSGDSAFQHHVVVSFQRNHEAPLKGNSLSFEGRSDFEDVGLAASIYGRIDLHSGADVLTRNADISFGGLLNEPSENASAAVYLTSAALGTVGQGSIQIDIGRENVFRRGFTMSEGSRLFSSATGPDAGALLVSVEPLVNYTHPYDFSLLVSGQSVIETVSGEVRLYGGREGIGIVGSHVRSTGADTTGRIVLNGVNHSAQEGVAGILVTSGSTLETVNADIHLAGHIQRAVRGRIGVAVYDSQVQSTGAGSISVGAHVGEAARNSIGFQLKGPAASIQTQEGRLSINAWGRTARPTSRFNEWGGDNLLIDITGGADVTSAGGAVSFGAFGLEGYRGDGIRIGDSVDSSVITAGPNSSLKLRAYSDDQQGDIRVMPGAVIGSPESQASITLEADEFELEGLVDGIQTQGNVFFDSPIGTEERPFQIESDRDFDPDWLNAVSPSARQVRFDVGLLQLNGLSSPHDLHFDSPVTVRSNDEATVLEGSWFSFHDQLRIENNAQLQVNGNLQLTRDSTLILDREATGTPLIVDQHLGIWNTAGLFGQPNPDPMTEDLTLISAADWQGMFGNIVVGEPLPYDPNSTVTLNQNSDISELVRSRVTEYSAHRTIARNKEWHQATFDLVDAGMEAVPGAIPVGDFDGDGHQDFAVSVTRFQNPADANPISGEIRLLKGSPTLATTEDLLTSEDVMSARFFAESADRLGIVNAVAGADINGDGYSDLLLSTSSSGEPVSDSLDPFIVWGGPDAFVDRNLLEPSASQTSISMASGQLYPIGDINGDGWQDLAVADPLASHDENDPQADGIVTVIYGQESWPEELNQQTNGNSFRIFPGTAATQFGSNIVALGDVNGDSRDDFAVTAPKAVDSEGNTAGMVLVFYGRARFSGDIDLSGSSKSADLVITAPADAGSLQIQGSGDVTGDGAADILVSASDYFQATTTGKTYGKSWLIAGADDLPGEILLETPSDGVTAFGIPKSPLTLPEQPSSWSGQIVGDINKDGVDDLVFNVPPSNGTAASGIYVLFGGTDWPQQVDFTSEEWLDTWLPYSGGPAPVNTRIAPAGDLNSDGQMDLVVSQNFLLHPTATAYNSGYIISGEQVFDDRRPVPTLTETTHAKGLKDLVYVDVHFDEPVHCFDGTDFQVIEDGVERPADQTTIPNFWWFDTPESSKYRIAIQRLRHDSVIEVRLRPDSDIVDESKNPILVSEASSIRIDGGNSGPIIHWPNSDTVDYLGRVSWYPVVNATSYEFWLQQLASGTEPLIRTNTSDNFLSVGELAAGRYRLWVQATLESGQKTQWTSRSFVYDPVPRPRAVSPGQWPSPIESADGGQGPIRFFATNHTTGEVAVIDEVIELEDGGQRVPILGESATMGRYSIWAAFTNATGWQGGWSEAMTYDVAPVLDEIGTHRGMPDVVTWTSVNGAATYDLYVSGNGFVYERSGLEGNRYVPDFDLSQGMYRMWLRGVTEDGHQGPWSQVVTFYTEGTTRAVVWDYGGRLRAFWPETRPDASYEIWIVDAHDPIHSYYERVETTSYESPPLPAGTYQFWVKDVATRGDNRWGIASEVVIEGAGNPGGEIPVPLSPTGGRFGLGITFQWEPVPEAESYHLLLRDGDNYIHLWENSDGSEITSPEYSTQWAFASEEIEWWVRARFSNSGSWGPYSSKATFTTRGRPKVNPYARVFSDTDQRISWGDVFNAASYEVQINRIGETSEMVARQRGLTQSWYEPIPLLSSGSYRIWVRAISVDGELSPWSTGADFIVV